MSDRLVKEWVSKPKGDKSELEVVFAESGKKGKLGEDEHGAYFDHLGYNWQAVDARKEQVEGVDIVYQHPSWNHGRTLQCKNNMFEDGTFLVYKWILTCHAEVVSHCYIGNGFTKFANYTTKSMREYFRENSGKWKTDSKGQPYLPFNEGRDYPMKIYRATWVKK